MKTIKELRKEINKIDQDILCILNRRGKLVQQIGLEKMKANINIYIPEHEAQKLENLKSLNNGPYSSQMIEDIYMEIFKSSRVLQICGITNLHASSSLYKI